MPPPFCTGRLVSGVHRFTDIMGGALLSAGPVTMYRRLTEYYLQRSPSVPRRRDLFS